MTTTSPLFDINQLNLEQQKTFHAVYNELKPNHTSYLQYKLNLQLKTKFDSEQEENEWHYELYRYLRARKWNVPHTIKSILEMIQWRTDNHVDSILEQQSVSLRVDLLRKIDPSGDHGHTKADLPLYIEKSGLIHVDKMLNRFTSEELFQCLLYRFELNCQLARERSRQVGKHVESFATISDMNGCNLEMRKLLPLSRQANHIYNNYYPERIGQMFIINPPMIFPILWNLTKSWLDPVLKERIFVIKKGPETAKTLLQHIDSDQLPQEYGGSCQTCATSPDCIPVHD